MINILANRYGLTRLVHQRNIDGLESEQIVVAAGESGSGKTQVTNIALDFFLSPRPGGSSDILMANKLRDIDVVLSALGNAKTGRNDNSSRFVRGRFLTNTCLVG